jgi:DNA-binding transcriptional regulator GbsR (MarR family)
MSSEPAPTHPTEGILLPLPPARPVTRVEGLEEPLAQQLPQFELFFKTVGFKRVHGRIWGLLVLIGRPLTAKEISESLHLSQGATSTALHELTEWGAITSEFDHERRCHLHGPVSNTLSIAATVIRRREQVVFQQFKVASQRMLHYVQERHGERDPRVLTLRSIISTCEIAEAVMQLVVGAVASALDDSTSVLHKAISAALKVGVVMPGRLLLGRAGLNGLVASALGEEVPRLAAADVDSAPLGEGVALAKPRRRRSASKTDPEGPAGERRRA